MIKEKTITHLNFAKGFRGGERQTLLLIKELANRAYKQKLFTRMESELADRLKGTKNLEIIKISKPYILNISKIKGSTLLHAHETKAAQFAYLVNMIYKIPYIITRRVDNPISNNFFNKSMYEKSNYTISLSNAISNELLKISKKINMKIIPSAYSKLDINESEVENIKNRFKDKFLIGNIGELDNVHKGQYYLLEAMKKISKKYPNIHLILLGKGQDEQKYKEQMKGYDNVTFEGFVDNVGDYISCLDMFVFPSLNEGLGSILLDVMQAKVPIIASDVGGIPDIINNNKNGVLVETKNSEAIFEAIERLYLNKNLGNEFSEEAFKTIDNFSFENMCNRYIEIYEEINEKDSLVLQQPIGWDKYSDQPYVIEDKAYKRSMRKKHILDYLKLFFTSVIVLPISILIMKFFKANEKLEYGIGVNLDKGDEQFDLIKELNAKYLIIRMPLWDMDNIDEYVNFAKRFKEQDNQIEILLNVMQDREHIDNVDLLKKDFKIVFEKFSSFINEYKVGTTINRVKWGFFSVSEYLKFYKTVQDVRDEFFKDLKLIGPSVIDFEYYFTCRALFNTENIKYDVHSSLLYVDRRGSPYNTQYKIFDTKNKVDLLYSLTKLSWKSSNVIYITEANWPLSNTEPYAPTSEHECVSEEEYKKAMLEYHDIVKNTKKIKRVYWHQLIAPGYGLVDNRDGKIRKMPAFDAYKKMINDK